MGLLVDGVWHDRWYDTKSSGGRFVRQESPFRDWITADGSSGFPAAAGRYHLYVSLACPWAHRTLIFRALKGLEAMISVSVVNPYMAEHGWTFAVDEGVVPDPHRGAEYLHQIYTAADPGHTGRVTVPVLWDREGETIVNNESSEIIRMFNAAFDGLGATGSDYYPEALREEIDAINARVYSAINNGVYKAGFATEQAVYEAAVTELFAGLDEIEARLADQRYLVGERITEADWRLFTTLVRFDPVYHGHFKCNLRRLADYPNLWNYTRELYQHANVAATVDMRHIKRHYYASHRMVNPTGIVPAGPVIDFDAAHDRARLRAS